MYSRCISQMAVLVALPSSSKAVLWRRVPVRQPHPGGHKTCPASVPSTVHTQCVMRDLPASTIFLSMNPHASPSCCAWCRHLLPLPLLLPPGCCPWSRMPLQRPMTRCATCGWRQNWVPDNPQCQPAYVVHHHPSSSSGSSYGYCLASTLSIDADSSKEAAVYSHCWHMQCAAAWCACDARWRRPHGHLQAVDIFQPTPVTMSSLPPPRLPRPPRPLPPGWSLAPSWCGSSCATAPTCSGREARWVASEDNRNHMAQPKGLYSAAVHMTSQLCFNTYDGFFSCWWSC